MARVVVEYTATFKQIIDWPDDELQDFNYENLECNIDPEKSEFTGGLSIDEVYLNGEPHDF